MTCFKSGRIDAAALWEGEGRQENGEEGGVLANVEQLARHRRSEGERVMTSCKRWKGERRGRRRKTKRECGVGGREKPLC